MDNFIYLFITNYESRSEVRSAVVKDKVVELYEFMDRTKPESFIREKVGTFNTKYYKLNSDGEKVFVEQLYVQKIPILGI